jgi:hypothetical protein
VGWLGAVIAPYCGASRRLVGSLRAGAPGSHGQSAGAVPAPWSDVRLSVVLRTGDAHRGFKQRWFAVGSSSAFQGGGAMALN